MTKQQAEQLLRQLIDTIKLTRQEYAALLSTIEVLKAESTVETK